MEEIAAGVALQEAVLHLELQHEVPGGGGGAVGLAPEIGRHVQNPAHIAHGAPADLLDAAVVGPVLPGVRVEEQHMEVGVGREETHPLDLIPLGGEEGHELLQGVQIVVHHLPHQQIVVAVSVVVHLHEREGEVSGNPPLPAAEHHVGHIKDTVGVHVVVEGGPVGALHPAAVVGQHRLPVVGLGVAQAGLVPEGPDVTGLGGVQRVLVAEAVAHLVVERGVEGVQAADWRA